MPIYEYMCKNCKESFSLLQKMDTDKDAVCPRCGSTDVKKNLSTFSCSFPADSGSSSMGSYSGFGGGG